MTDGGPSERGGMTSPTPYLLRGLYEWICDNGMAPYLRVVVDDDRVVVPMQYVEGGVIVLNASPSAVRDLDIDNDTVRFSARFSGKSFDVFVPVDKVQAIYSRETGQGLVFFEDDTPPERSTVSASDEGPQDPDGGPKDGPDRPNGRPRLRIVD